MMYTQYIQTPELEEHQGINGIYINFYFGSKPDKKKKRKLRQWHNQYLMNITRSYERVSISIAFPSMRIAAFSLSHESFTNKIL